MVENNVNMDKFQKCTVIKYLFLKGGVPSNFEKLDGCLPWILLTEKECFGDNVWMYDASVPWKFELKILGDGRQWNRQWFQVEPEREVVK